MMKAKCRCYKPADKYGACHSNNCPGIIPYRHYCSIGIIYIDWIGYIKDYNILKLYFNFEDIIYDES